jgi:hypothetical protein
MWEGGEYVSFLSRMGKGAETGVDVLERAGGSLHYTALAKVMGIKRARSLFRVGGWLSKLEDAGVVDVDASENVSLTDSWVLAWNERREQDGELDDYRKDMRVYERRRAAWRVHLKDLDDRRRSDRLARTAASCFDVPVLVASNQSEADGFICELEPIEQCAAASLVEGPEFVEEPQPSPELSELALAIRAYLDQHPQRAREAPSWLANTLWAYELVVGKPSVYEVVAALGELAHDRKEAA